MRDRSFASAAIDSARPCAGRLSGRTESSSTVLPVARVPVPPVHEVRGYDAKGKVLRTITGKSVKGQEFDVPMGIAYDATSKELVVADLRGKIVRLQVQ